MVFGRKAGLSRELGLLDVIALSVGAMISAGFFLLPGIAAMQAGPSVFIAYLLAAVLMLPAMFSMAELATATPKAGGAYFFIDRSLGPLFGTIGGIGNYLALVMKTSFALVGIGAYAMLFFDIPVRLTAILIGLVFMVTNVLGVKKTTRMQQLFVWLLVAILLYFVLEGLREVFLRGAENHYFDHFVPFMPNGIEGLLSTTGLVFVSYLGLTEIASMSEEIRNPERNIPLGMILSLLITALIYVLGVFIMVSVIPPEQLWNDLAPASTAARKVFSLVSPAAGTVLIVVAAVTAFASTGNAGLMTTSRFPLAMSRDRKLPPMFSRINRYSTPDVSVVATALILFSVILLFSETNIARLASSFQLLIFMLLNASVIVMRNSRIEAYDPGYVSPFYPWMQIFGMMSAFVLIIYLGWGPALFLMGMIVVAVVWYWYYARRYAVKEGAIYNWFAILGKHQQKTLENEFLHILKEKGLRDGDPFDELIVQATITNLGYKRVSFRSLLGIVTKQIAGSTGHAGLDDIRKSFLGGTGIDPALVIPQVSILHAKSTHIDKPVLHIVVSERGIKKPVSRGEAVSENNIRVFFFMLNKVERPKQQLRYLSRLMDIVEREHFVEEMTRIKNPREIKEYLLHNDRYITLYLQSGSKSETFINKPLKEIRLPGDVLVAMIQRDDKVVTPRGDTILREDDIITIIGEPKGIKTLFVEYIHKKNGG